MYGTHSRFVRQRRNSVWDRNNSSRTHDVHDGSGSGVAKATAQPTLRVFHERIFISIGLLVSCWESVFRLSGLGMFLSKAGLARNGRTRIDPFIVTSKNCESACTVRVDGTCARCTRRVSQKLRGAPRRHSRPRTAGYSTNALKHLHYVLPRNDVGD